MGGREPSPCKCWVWLCIYFVFLCILRAEIAVALFAFGLILCVGSLNAHMLQASTALAMMASYALGIAAALLFLLDIMFSLVVCFFLYRALREVEENLWFGHHGGLSFRDRFIARSHLILVVLCMLTTSLLYFSLGICIAKRSDLDNLSERDALYMGVVITWLSDSVCNDVCMLLVGFGPNFETEAKAVNAAGIGNAVGVSSEIAPTDPAGEASI